MIYIASTNNAIVCIALQAYTAELESLVTQLEEENAQLRRHQVAI